MNILELKFNAGKSNGGSGGGVTTAQLDAVKAELQIEINELWDEGVGGNADNITALTEKLNGTSTASASTNENVSSEM